MSLWSKHAIFEKNSIILLIGILIVIAIGGLVEIAPLFYLKSTIEQVGSVRPYSPLELAGRNIYVREGCYNCHSQMIRPLRDEVERYGHYSLAAESMYDRPFQWGSKRTGPDPWLAKTELDFDHIADDLKVQSRLGVPYSAEMIANARADVMAQATPDHPGAVDLIKRYPRALARDFDGNLTHITEADALIAYLQLLGTQVDFKLYNDKANIR